jgi:hypothetical protein
MTPISISRAALSDVIWRCILDNAEVHKYEQRSLFALMTDLNPLRAEAQYQTGSVSGASAWLLYGTALYFKPKLIAEVGTYIGRSATALGYGAGMDNAATLLTCDASNDFDISSLPNATLRQYRKQTSTQMLEDMVQRSERADLLHIDGRLNEFDLKLMDIVTHDRTVFLLDDFEGFEKGVANAKALMHTLKEAYYVLVYPPSAALLKGYGLNAPAPTGMLLPRTLLTFSVQQSF